MLETFLEILVTFWIASSIGLGVVILLDWADYKKQVLDQTTQNTLWRATIILITVVFAPVFISGALYNIAKRK